LRLNQVFHCCPKYLEANLSVSRLT
jgi:hypothetical protein